MEAYFDSLSFEGLRYATTVVWFCESDMPFPTDKKNNAELCWFWIFRNVVILRDKSETFRVYQSKGTAGEATSDLK